MFGKRKCPGRCWRLLSRSASALTFACAGIAAFAFPNAAGQVPANNDNPPRAQSELCVRLGGNLRNAQGDNETPRKICSGMDQDNTFCIPNSAPAFPCAGLLNHVIQCNRDFQRPALNPFLCGPNCPRPEDNPNQTQARGGKCEFPHAASDVENAAPVRFFQREVAEGFSGAAQTVTIAANYALTFYASDNNGAYVAATLESPNEWEIRAVSAVFAPQTIIAVAHLLREDYYPVAVEFTVALSPLPPLAEISLVFAGTDIFRRGDNAVVERVSDARGESEADFTMTYLGTRNGLHWMADSQIRQEGARANNLCARGGEGWRPPQLGEILSAGATGNAPPVLAEAPEDPTWVTAGMMFPAPQSELPAFTAALSLTILATGAYFADLPNSDGLNLRADIRADSTSAALPPGAARHLCVLPLPEYVPPPDASGTEWEFADFLGVNYRDNNARRPLVHPPRIRGELLTLFARPYRYSRAGADVPLPGRGGGAPMIRLAGPRDPQNGDIYELKTQSISGGGASIVLAARLPVPPGGFALTVFYAPPVGATAAMRIDILMLPALFVGESPPDAEDVREILQSGADPDSAGKDREPPLLIAAARGWAPIVSVLVAEGADPAASGRRNRLAPHAIVENERGIPWTRARETLESFIAAVSLANTVFAGWSVQRLEESGDLEGETPLEQAVKEFWSAVPADSVELVRMAMTIHALGGRCLFEPGNYGVPGVSFVAVDTREALLQENPLCGPSWDSALLERVAQQGPVVLNTDGDGIESRNGPPHPSAEHIQALIGQGANVNREGGSHALLGGRFNAVGHWPLNYAVYHAHAEAVGVLLANNATLRTGRHSPLSDIAQNIHGRDWGKMLNVARHAAAGLQSSGRGAMDWSAASDGLACMGLTLGVNGCGGNANPPYYPPPEADDDFYELAAFLYERGARCDEVDSRTARQCAIPEEMFAIRRDAAPDFAGALATLSARAGYGADFRLTTAATVAGVDIAFVEDGRQLIFSLRGDGSPPINAGFAVTMMARGTLAARLYSVSLVVGEALPLHQAARDGNADEVARLLNGGADANQRDSAGETALMIAAAAGPANFAAVAATLMGAGAMLDLGRLDGDGATHIAARAGHAEVLSVLMTLGADAERPGHMRRAPLHVIFMNESGLPWERVLEMTRILDSGLNGRRPYQSRDLTAFPHASFAGVFPMNHLAAGYDAADAAGRGVILDIAEFVLERGGECWFGQFSFADPVPDLFAQWGDYTHPSCLGREVARLLELTEADSTLSAATVSALASLYIGRNATYNYPEFIIGDLGEPLLLIAARRGHAEALGALAAALRYPPAPLTRRNAPAPTPGAGAAHVLASNPDNLPWTRMLTATRAFIAGLERGPAPWLFDWNQRGDVDGDETAPLNILHERWRGADAQERPLLETMAALMRAAGGSCAENAGALGSPEICGESGIALLRLLLEDAHPSAVAVSLLLDSGASASARDRNNDPFVVLAARKAHAEALGVLITRGASPGAYSQTRRFNIPMILANNHFRNVYEHDPLNPERREFSWEDAAESMRRYLSALRLRGPTEPENDQRAGELQYYEWEFSDDEFGEDLTRYNALDILLAHPDAQAADIRDVPAGMLALHALIVERDARPRECVAGVPFCDEDIFQHFDESVEVAAGYSGAALTVLAPLVGDSKYYFGALRKTGGSGSESFFSLRAAEAEYGADMLIVSLDAPLPLGESRTLEFTAEVRRADADAFRLTGRREDALAGFFRNWIFSLTVRAAAPASEP